MNRLYKKNIHIVSHTHWDREWYFSTSDSLVLLDQIIKDVLQELEQNPTVNFTLDGQLSILEDYLKINPHDMERIKKLVKEKRLYVGPWYTQTDTQLINPNSIVNNMYYGIKKTKKLFNDYMKVGYLPDTFGFPNQMPMIMSQFGINNLIMWRGANFNKQNIKPYFNWIGQDESKITGIILHNGYGMAKGFNNTDVFIEKKLDPLIQEFSNLTKMNNILIPVGNDQNNIVPELDKKISKAEKQLDNKYNFNISNYEEFIEAINKELDTTHQGEFRETAYTRVHKSAGGIRTDIKMSNYYAEIELLKNLQPLNAMAMLEGVGVSNTLIEEAWKKLFEGQAHDGIVGCVSDPVREDIVVRNRQALELALSSQNYIKKEYSKMLNLEENEILLFNLEPHKFKGYKEIEIITNYEDIKIKDVHSYSVVSSQFFPERAEALVEKPEGNSIEKEKAYYIHKVLLKVTLPSFGYKVVPFEEKEKEKEKEKAKNYISNDTYRIEVNENRLQLITSDGIIDNFITLVDDGNEGDTYDYSPPENNREIKLDIKDYEIKIKENTEILLLDCTTALPYNLKDRVIIKNQVESEAKIRIELRDDKNIRVKVLFNNKVLNHRLRLRIKDFKFNQSFETLAATPFGVSRRKIKTDRLTTDWTENNVEYPSDIETNSGFVSFSNVGKQLVIYNKGVKEYQASNNSIYMTLFSSTDELGKPNLNNRPGRASGDTTKKGHIRMLTPKAQVLGEHEYEFMINFQENDIETLYRTLDNFETPTVYYQNQKLNLFHERIDNKIDLIGNYESIAKEKSYMELNNKLHVQSIYSSFDNGQMVIRFMTYEDFSKKDLDIKNKFKIGNLLEEGDNENIKSLRLYTLRKDQK